MQAFGTYGTTYSSSYEPGCVLDVYGKLDSHGLVAVILPSKELSDPFAISDYPVDSAVYFAANNKQGYTGGQYMESYYYYPGFAYIFYLETTEEDLRKSMEIGNSEATDIQLYFSQTDEYVTFLTR